MALAARSLFLPGIGWSAALLIGIVAALWDARLFHEAEGRPRVPRAIADTLKSRELVGRIVILATLGLVEDALATRSPLLTAVLDNYLVAVIGGIAAGLATGKIAVWLRRRIDPSPVEIAVSIATPYVAALWAEAFGLSAAASIITSALVVSGVRVDRDTGSTISSNEARINATAFWEVASLMVASVLFILAGRAVPQALRVLEVWPVWQVALTASGLLVIALTVQLCFSFDGAHMAPVRDAIVRGPGEKSPTLKTAAVMTWSCSRSVIGLVIALSVPATLPDGTRFAERDLVLALGTLLVIASVLLQGLTLRRVVDRAALANPDEQEREEEEARHAMRDAADTPGGESGDGFDAARQQLLAAARGEQNRR